MEYSKVIYVCENTPDGVFTAVYDVWAAYLNREENFEMLADGMYELELFANYVYVQTDTEKARKVARSVCRKISTEAYRQVYAASLSYEQDKIMAIYRFLKLGFKVGSLVTDMHAKDEVCRVFELCRSVGNEACRFREFIRFSEIENGVLFARIKPKSFVLPLIAGHFADRFPEENFAIIDDNMQMGIFHEKGKGYFLSPIDLQAIEEVWQREKNGEYEQLWKTFFDSIAICERYNYKCQRNLCALRYRDYMVEFDA